MKKTSSTRPPALADRILRWYCGGVQVDDLHGDLEELFYIHCDSMSVWKAKFFYWKNALSIIFSYTLKRRRQTAAYSPYSARLSTAMLRNYFVVATRNLSRHKFFSIINVLGLAIGMSISLLLIAMLSFLWTYDDFHVNKENIYRIISSIDDQNQKQQLASAPAVLAERLKNDYTGTKEVVRISSTLSAQAAYGDKILPLSGYFTDPSFLQVFSFPLIKGNKEKALQKPNSIVLTEETSTRFFGKEDPIGKIIEIQGVAGFEVTGVLQDVPKNSHMAFQALVPYEILNTLRAHSDPTSRNVRRGFRDSYIYLLLPADGEVQKIERFLSEIAGEIYTTEKQYAASFRLQSLKDIVPGLELHNQIGPSWGYASLGIFAFLTLMILLPACFNYANISISRALKRMKEIGLRKVMGGQKNQIFFQFITETIIITLVALSISFGIFHVIRTEFLNLLVGSEALELEPDLRTIVYFLLFAITVGLLAGFIPAIYFSKLTPIQALKSKPSSKSPTSFTFRKFLVVSQFALSTGFIMGVVIVLSQYYYTLNFDFGFGEENILDVELQATDPQIFKNEFSKLSSVNKISMSSHVLGTEVAAPVWVKNPDHGDSTEVFHMSVDENYISNFALSLKAGDDFSSDVSRNTRSVIVNEEFVEAFALGSPVEAIGETFVLPGQEKEFQITGVVDNFHFLDLRAPIKSFVFKYDPSEFKVANIKITGSDIFGTLTAMESVWKKFAGEKKFIARFFEDEIQEMYSIYFSMIKICGFLAFLAISISCLGLLGMVVFTVENRVKEIGIRKVMGATEMNVVVLLSKQFIKLMAIAAAIAVPFTWLFFEKSFLSTYHYKIEIGIVEIGLSVFILTVIGLATILSQTIRAASANPVDSLRSE